MRTRPGRVTVAAVVLILVAVLTVLIGWLGVVGYFGSFQGGGVATPTTLELVVGAIVQASIPLGLALAAGAAASGLMRGRSWGRTLAIAIGALFLVGGLALAWSALREWGLPGSFSALLAPPAVVALVVGGYVAYAAATSGSYFTDG
jgi:hypothetical protein